MENKKALNEETYQKNKKKITKVAIIVLVVGILIGGSLIVAGLIKQIKVNSNYSEESKGRLQEKIATEKQKLETKKEELESKGIKYDSFVKYDDGESYDLKIITEALNPVFNNCAFSEYKNNALTATYCSYVQQLDEFTNSHKNIDSFDSVPFYMFGSIVIIMSCIIAGSIYMFVKRREILAFSTQQVMPVAQEGIEKMSPVFADTAKEISKGIKEGINEADNNNKNE